MPAAVSETGVRAPAHAPITSGRPHAGADQASSPFSELLNNCEASGDETPDLAAPKPAAADVSTPETPVVVAKTTTPEIDPQVPKAKDAGQAEAELALAIVAAVPQPSGEKPAQPVALAETTDASAPQETKPETDGSAQTDTSDAADAVAVPQQAQTDAVAVPVPVPVAMPALTDAPDAPEATDAVVAATEQTAQTAATAPVDADVPDFAAAVAAKVAAPAAKEGDTAAPRPVSRKTTPKADIAAGVKAETKSDSDEAKTKSSDGAVAEATTDSAPAAKPNHSADAIANPAQGKVETNDDAPKAPVAQAAADAATNTNALPAPAATNIANPAVAQTAHQVTAKDGVPDAGLPVEIAAHAQAGKNHFEIRLDPPELGRIDVRLHIDGDGKVTSHVRVERSETLDLLRRDAPQLERALQQAGLKTFDGGMQFSLRDQSFAQREQNQNMPAVARIVLPDDTLAQVETQRSYGRLAGLGSGVDIRV